MNAGFFRRAFSSLLDVSLIILVLYLTFILGGRTILRNQVPDFDEVYAAYNEIVEAYNTDLNAIYEQYSADIELAGDDETLVTAAQTAFDEAKAALDTKQEADLAPYDETLTPYFLNCILYFGFGFLILMTLYTVLLKGMTLGRRVMQLKLEGAINPISLFFHDIIGKYFFVIVLSFLWNPYMGLLIAGLMILLDVIMLNFGRKKQTLRDMLVKISIVRTGYGY